MKHCRQMVRRCSLFYLFLISCFATVATPGQSAPRITAPERWERVYAEPRGAGFRAVYSAPMRLRKTSALSWLWVGDANGFVRVAALDADSAVPLGPQPGPPAPYFGLSRLTVGVPQDGGGRLLAPINALTFLNEGSGYLLKGNNLYATDDAGFSWGLIYRERDLPEDGAATLFSISVTQSKHACMVGWYTRPKGGTQSLILCATKSLEHDDPQWRRVDVTPRQGQLFNVFFLNDRRGWIAGTKGTILKTENGGKSWRPVRTGSESLFQTYFVDEENGWAVGRPGVVLHSDDGGDHWKPVRVTLDRGAGSITLRGVGFTPDKKNGWIVGEQGTILHTGDGGGTWHQQKLPPSDLGGQPPNLYALFVERNACWAVGDSGSVWRYRLR